jgi:hypothetical protein
VHIRGAFWVLLGCLCAPPGTRPHPWLVFQVLIVDVFASHVFVCACVLRSTLQCFNVAGELVINYSTTEAWG